MQRREALRRTTWLTGAALSTPALMSMLQSCKEQERVSWNPVFLDIQQAAFISSFVDVLLPATHTPGARDVNVDVFIDRLYAETLDANGQAMIKQEITKLNDRARETYGEPFADLSPDDQRAFFAQLESETATFNPGVWGTAVGTQEPVGYYRSLKSTALWAYFTSEEIGKHVLNYDPIPGAYRGCLPLKDVGNLWSL